MITITQAEQQVREQLGTGFGVVKLGRFWVIGRTDLERWRFLTQAGTLDKAIRQAKEILR